MILIENKKKGFTDERSEAVFDKLYNLIKDIPAKCWIAGGAILCSYIGEEINDIDLYFTCGEEFNKAKDYLLQLGANKIKDSNCSLTLELNGLEYDLVRVFYDNAKSTIVNFDFTICCIAINKKGNLYYDSKFFKHLDEKELVFNKKCDMLADMNTSLRRVNKYGMRGFSISKKETEKLLDYHEKDGYTGGGPNKSYMVRGKNAGSTSSTWTLSFNSPTTNSTSNISTYSDQYLKI